MTLRGLYAVTPEWDDTDALCERVDAALRGGATLVQYRHKSATPAHAERQARRLLDVCRRHARPLLINDSVDLMCAVDADGVHLGRDDADPAAARARLGAGKLIGVSCYDRFELAQRHAAAADYVAFGSVFLSKVKPGAVRAPLSLFGQARARGLRTAAIGGIDGSNASQVIAAGADMIAVISALFDAPDTEAAARSLAGMFDAR
jgi:thiamine-phosphate pyrophosphorylase